MSKEISLEEIKKFWPEKAPDINIVQKYVSKYEKEKIVIKYGGNVLIDRKVFNNFISDIDYKKNEELLFSDKISNQPKFHMI